MIQSPALAYFWGEDAYSIDRASREYAIRIAPAGEVMDTWRASLDDDSGDGDVSSSIAKRRARTLDAIEQHIATAPMFGAGTFVLVRQPAGLLAEASARDRLIRLVADIPPGNALCFTDLVATGARVPSAKGVLRDAIAAAGGVVAEFQVPAPGRMEPWLIKRGVELGVVLEPAAAHLLADRVGAHVRESDVDRRRRTELANAELEKLALYQPDGTVTAANVDELVAEAIPGSMWALLDAIAARAGAQAATLAHRLLNDGTPLPVLVGQVHRRLRDLVFVREHIDSGARPPEIVKAMKLQPFRAKKLSDQALRWSMESLETALRELLELDLRSKGISLDGSTVQMSERIDALAFQTWLARNAVVAERTTAGRPAPRHGGGPDSARRC